MLEALLSLLGGLVALLLWWWRRRAEKQDQPLNRHQSQYEAIDREISTTSHHQAGALRGGLADDLDELERLQKSKGNRR